MLVCLLALAAPLFASGSRATAHKTRQTPNIVNGLPIPVAIEQMQLKAAQKLKSTTASNSRNAADFSPLSIRRKRLQQIDQAIGLKAKSNATRVPVRSAVKALTTASGKLNFPGLQVTPSVAGISDQDTSVVYASVTADVNKDGKQDLVVVQSDGTVNVLLNPATGAFADWKITSSNTTAVLNPTVVYARAQAIDLNGDGYPDLVALDLVNNALFVYINNHKGGFNDPIENDITLSTGATFNSNGGDALAVDVNHDGIPDLVVTGFYAAENNYTYTTTVSVLTMLGNGDGTFAAPLAEQTATFNGDIGEEYGQLTGGDMNKDGNFDLVMPVSGHDNSYNFECFIQVLTGNGDGTFQMKLPNAFTATAIPSMMDTGYSAHAVADVDGDGIPDVLYSASTDGNVYLAKGNGDGTLQAPTLVSNLLGNYINGSALTVNIADVNGDGNLDIIGYHGGFTVVLLNQGKGVFSTSPIQLVSGLAGVIEPVPADFNNDGTIDLVMVDMDSGLVGFYPGANGSFQGVTAVAPKGESAAGFFAYSAGDVNGDGTPDILAKDITDETPTSSLDLPDLMLGTNDGKGNFTYTKALTASTMDSSETFAMYAPLADFNGDGKADLLFAGYSSDPYGQTVQIAYSNPDGTYQTPVALPLGVTLGCTASALDVADINNDGYKDILIAYQGDTNCGASQGGGQQSGIFVLLNDHKGSFTTSFVPYGYALDLIKAVDLNGDGKLDLLLSDASSTYAYYYLYALPGNGDGTFNLSGAQYVEQNTVVTSIIPGDFDGDGVQDLTIGVETLLDSNDSPQQGSTGVYLMKGNGDLTFGTPVVYAAGTYPLDGQYADLNGDGYPDLILNEVAFDYFESVYTPSTVVFQNMGKGALASTTLGFTAPSSGYDQRVFVEDFNGDGSLDVLLSTDSTIGYDAVDRTELSLNTGGDLLSLVATSSTVAQDSTVTLTATVVPSLSTATPTGAISFVNNGTLLQSVAMSDGTATLVTSALPTGTNTITALYSGDANLNASSSTASVAVVVSALAPDFTLSSASPSSLSLAQGQSGSAVVTLNANATFSGSVALTCGGQPAEATCSVFPSTVTLNGSQSTQLSVVVVTTPPNNKTEALHRNRSLFGLTGSTVLAGLFFLVPGLKRRKRLLSLVVLVVVAGFGMAGLTGCGTSYKYPGTPVGTTQLTLTAQSGSITKTVTLPLTINK